MPLPATDDLVRLVHRAAAGDTVAYDRIAARFRDLVHASAYARLGDLHLAEDVTQEAFAQAYSDLPKLREPAAFSGWLRRIVLTHCDRVTRRKRVPTVPLEAATDVAAPEPGPESAAEDAERRALVQAAIRSLPDREREVTLLFYIRDHSQREIADFLQVPVTTVNNRLHRARTLLRERMLAMVEKTVPEFQLPEDFRVILPRPSATQTAAPGLAWFRDRWVMIWQDGVRGDPWDHPFWFLLAESGDGKDWSEPRRLDLPPQFQQLPRLCVRGDELVMHTHDWHHGVRIARSRDLETWSDTRLAVGVSGRGAPFVRGSTLYLAYARWLEVDNIGDAVELMASTDGLTWRWLTPPLPGRGTGISDAIGLASEDRLYAFWPEHYYGDDPRPATYVNWSEDDGQTWSDPVRVDPFCPPTTPGGVTPVTAAFAPDGRLALLGEAWHDDGTTRACLALSPDRGQTWPTRGALQVGSLRHLTFAFAPDGTLLVAGSTQDAPENRPVVLHMQLPKG